MVFFAVLFADQIRHILISLHMHFRQYCRLSHSPPNTVVSPKSARCSTIFPCGIIGAAGCDVIPFGPAFEIAGPAVFCGTLAILFCIIPFAGIFPGIVIPLFGTFPGAPGTAYCCVCTAPVVPAGFFLTSCFFPFLFLSSFPASSVPSGSYTKPHFPCYNAASDKTRTSPFLCICTTRRSNLCRLLLYLRFLRRHHRLPGLRYLWLRSISIFRSSLLLILPWQCLSLRCLRLCLYL